MNDEPTVQLLRAEQPRHPELREILELQIALFGARRPMMPPVPRAPLPAEAEERLARGEPLLPAEPEAAMAALGLDFALLARSLAAVCHVAAAGRPSEAEPFRELAGLAARPDWLRAAIARYLARTAHPSHRQVEPGPLDDKPPFQTFEVSETSKVSGDGIGAAREAQTLKVSETSQVSDDALLDFALNHALHPHLAAYTAAVQPLIDDEAWYRPLCPVCGGAADFAALLPGGGGRQLLCSRCDAQWQAPRAACPFCGADAPGQLSYFGGQDGIYRLYTCDACRRYLKTIDVRELARPVHLPAERILTIGLDLAAADAGYRPG